MLVSFPVPTAVSAAFGETLELHRAISGRETTVTSFVEALVAEAFAGPHPPDAVAIPLKPGLERSFIEGAMEHATENWRSLDSRGDPEEGFAGAGIALRDLERLFVRAGIGGATDLDEQLRMLIGLEDRIDRRLGGLLASMAERGAWSRLLFVGAGHYAEQRLGLARTSAEDRAALARAVRSLPVLRAAYESGAVGFEAALIVRRVLGRAGADEETERAWVSRASEATIKRLRDEVRALGLRRVLEQAAGRGRATVGMDATEFDRERAPEFAQVDVAGFNGEGSPESDQADVAELDAGRNPEVGQKEGAAPDGIVEPIRSIPLPQDDASWHASLQRVPGTCLERVGLLGRLAATTALSDCFLRLRLPAEIASDFLSAIESAGRALTERAEQVPWHEPWPDEDAPGSMLAARTFSIRCRRAPSWIGLLALLEDFAHTWDSPEAFPKRHGDAVYKRAGWRCSAPGCTSRQNLEEHHVVYRSRGGSNELSNLICACRFHHQEGEHGGLASCCGRAPLGILWSLGKGGMGGAFRNERRIGVSRRAVPGGQD